jgi:hypothetical protein
MGRRRQSAPAPIEKAIQAAIVHHWRMLGFPDTLVAAIPNAGAMGQPGLTCGLGDLLVVSPSLPPGCVGFIELKREEHSPVSNAQRDFGRLCMKLGVPYALCVGRDEPIRLLEHWGVVRTAAA